MARGYIELSIPQTVSSSIQYLSVEHNGIAPREFLAPIIREYNCGILIIGSDGPELLRQPQANRIAGAVGLEEIAVTVVAGFLWLDSGAAYDICAKTWFTCEGNALILMKEPPEADFACSQLPDVSGPSKSAFSKQMLSVLKRMLSGDDVYVHDDFTETLIATKSTKMLDAVLGQVGGN